MAYKKATWQLRIWVRSPHVHSWSLVDFLALPVPSVCLSMSALCPICFALHLTLHYNLAARNLLMLLDPLLAWVRALLPQLAKYQSHDFCTTLHLAASFNVAWTAHAISFFFYWVLALGLKRVHLALRRYYGRSVCCQLICNRALHVNSM